MERKDTLDIMIPIEKSMEHENRFENTLFKYNKLKNTEKLRKIEKNRGKSK